MVIYKDLKKRISQNLEIAKTQAPDLQKEFRELEVAQNERDAILRGGKLELNLLDAQQKLAKEANDVLRIVEKMDEATLNSAIENYAEKNGITSLEARARTLQYLSLEWKKKIDAEMRNFFAKESVMDLVLQSDENWRVFENLFDEGYFAQLTTAVHFSKKSPNERGKKLDAMNDFLERIQEEFKEVEKISADEKLKMMFAEYLPEADFRSHVAKLENKEEKYLTSADLKKYTNHNFLPEAQTEFQKLLKSPDREKTIDLFFRTWFFGKMIRLKDYQFFRENYDCDEKTILNQKFGLLTQTEIHEYFESSGHATLKINGFDIVFDTFDERFRARDEFGKRTGYGQDFSASYFIRDKNGTSLAKYDEQKNIIGYKEAKEGSCRIFKHEEIRELFLEKILNYTKSDPEKAKLLYESFLKKYPHFAEAHNNFAVFLEKSGNIKNAILHYETTLNIDQTCILAHNNLADLFKKEGKDKEAIEHYKLSVAIKPDSMVYQVLACLLASSGKFAESREYYKKFEQSR